MKDKKKRRFLGRQKTKKETIACLLSVCVDKTLIEEGNPCFPYHAARLQKIFISE